jgi:hypothetical protein
MQMIAFQVRSRELRAGRGWGRQQRVWNTLGVVVGGLRSGGSISAPEAPFGGDGPSIACVCLRVSGYAFSDILIITVFRIGRSIFLAFAINSLYIYLFLSLFFFSLSIHPSISLSLLRGSVINGWKFRSQWCPSIVWAWYPISPFIRLQTHRFTHACSQCSFCCRCNGEQGGSGERNTK